MCWLKSQICLSPQTEKYGYLKGKAATWGSRLLSVCRQVGAHCSFPCSNIWSSLPEYLHVFHILVLENILQYKERSHVLSYSLQVAQPKPQFNLDNNIEFEIFSNKNATFVGLKPTAFVSVYPAARTTCTTENGSPMGQISLNCCNSFVIGQCVFLSQLNMCICHRSNCIFVIG